MSRFVILPQSSSSQQNAISPMNYYPINNNMRPPDKIDHNGTQYWYKTGTTILHNEEGPALIFTGGTKEYYLDGKRDRKDGLPTVTTSDKREEYHVKGKLHRDNDLPAKIDWNGTKYYYQYGVLNRNFGLPTIEYLDGGKVWHKDNKRYKYSYPPLEWEEGQPFPEKYKLDRLNSLRVEGGDFTRVLFSTQL
jgi:hypothetical protein